MHVINDSCTWTQSSKTSITRMPLQRFDDFSVLCEYWNSVNYFQFNSLLKTAFTNVFRVIFYDGSEVVELRHHVTRHLETFSLRMRRVTWPVHRGSPRTTRNNFWPRIIYSLYNFYGATTTIKGSFISEHPHVKAVFAAKSKSSQIAPPNGGF